MITRVWTGILYLIVGITFIILWSSKTSILQKLLLNKTILFWCIGWSSVGIGAGLIDTRDHSYGNKWWNWPLHYICYCGFVLLTISILSFVIALYSSGEYYVKPGVKFYSLSALVGGYLEDRFRSLATNNLKGKFNK